MPFPLSFPASQRREEYTYKSFPREKLKRDKEGGNRKRGKVKEVIVYVAEEDEKDD